MTGACLVVLLAVMCWLYGARYVEGGSMRPALVPGDVVIYQRRQAPRPGGLAVFEHGGAVVVHRVVGQNADGSCTTRGDANLEHDPQAVEASAMRGTVVCVVPIGRVLDRLVAAQR